MELSAAQREALLDAARAAADRAYAPYSRFRVGAAVLAGGQVFRGANVENASHGLAMCAERVAIFSAVAAGHREIEAIAVTCPDAPADASPGTRMPCGSCRQVMAEFGRPGMPVLIDGVGERSLAELLPGPFTLAKDES